MAVKEYQEALKLEPKLAQKLEFQSSFKKARVEYFYESGMKIKGQGLWDEAIKKFKKALDMDPNHALVKEAITDASVESSKAHYKKALYYADRGDLNKAIKELRQSIELDNDNVAAKEAFEIAVKTKKDNEIKAEKHFEAGMDHFKEKNWDKSLNELVGCIKLNPNHVLARSRIKEIKCQISAANDRHREGLDHFKRKDWNKAIVQFKEALKINPYHTKAQTKIYEAEKQKVKAEEIYQSANAYFKQKRWDEAIKEYRKAMYVNPNNTLATNMLWKALEEGAREKWSLGNDFLNKQDWPKAVGAFELALGYISNFAPAKEGLAEVYYQMGIEFEQRDMIGNALIEFKKSLEMVDNYKDCAEKIKVIVPEIKKRISYRVALLPFKNSSRERGIADVVGEGVLKELMCSKIENIEIIERGYLERILEEQKLSMTGLIDNATVVPVGKMKGVDAIITGNVLNFELYSDKRMETRSERYQSGSRSEFNPEYEQARRNYEDAMRRYEEAQKKEEEYRRRKERERREAERREREAERRARESKSFFNALDSFSASVSAFDNDPFGGTYRGMSTSAAKMALGSAESRLSSTPMHIQIPVYDYWRYNVYHCKKEATIKVSSRVVDTLTGKVLFAETISKKNKEEDDYLDNPNPSAGITYDPLELPSDAEMKDRILSNAVSKLSECICSSLGEYGIRYFILAEKAALHNDIENAVEQYVNFLYSSPKHASSKLDKTRHFLKIHRNYAPENWKVEPNKRYRNHEISKPASV